jgi:hypothetical protein
MGKSVVSKHDLEHAALVEIRALYGCENVIAVEIDRMDDPRFETNWKIAALRRANGPSDDRSALQLTSTIRAIETAQKKLRELYNLRPPGNPGTVRDIMPPSNLSGLSQDFGSTGHNAEPPPRGGY